MKENRYSLKDVLPLSLIRFIVKSYIILIYTTKKNPLKLIANRIFSKHKIVKLLSVKETLISFSTRIQIVKQFKADKYYSQPSYFPKILSNTLEYYKSTNKYLLKIHSVNIAGESNVILLDDNYALYDYKFQWDDRNISFNDRLVVHFSQNKQTLIKNIQPSEEIKNGIILSGNFSSNYYHYLYEFIARLTYINQANLDAKIPLIVDRVALDTIQFYEIIKLFNTQNRQIIPIEVHKSYKVQELYFVSCPNHIAPNYKNCTLIKATDTLFDIQTLSYLRNIFSSHLIAGNYPKRLYLSRKNASDRRKFNEKLVFELLKKYDFVEVHPEQYSVVEQMSMFAYADMIVSGSGAALSNIISCRPECVIICLINYKLPYSFFSTIATFTGAKLIYIHDTKLNIGNLKSMHEEFSVNIKQLESAIIFKY